MKSRMGGSSGVGRRIGSGGRTTGGGRIKVSFPSQTCGSDMMGLMCAQRL